MTRRFGRRSIPQGHFENADRQTPSATQNSKSTPGLFEEWASKVEESSPNKKKHQGQQGATLDGLEDADDDNDEINMITPGKRKRTSSTSTPRAKRAKTMATDYMDMESPAEESPSRGLTRSNFDEPEQRRQSTRVSRRANDEASGTGNNSVSTRSRPNSPSKPTSKPATPSKSANLASKSVTTTPQRRKSSKSGRRSTRGIEPIVPQPRQPTITRTRSGILAFDEAVNLGHPNTRTGPLHGNRRSPSRKSIDVVLRPRSAPSSRSSSPVKPTTPGRSSRLVAGWSPTKPATPKSSRHCRNLFRADSIPLQKSPRKLFLLEQTQHNIANWNHSAKKKAIRDVFDDDDDGGDEVRRTIFTGESPKKKSLFEIMDDQGSKALFLDGKEGYFEQHRTREKISTHKFNDVPDLPYSQLKQNVLGYANTWAQHRTQLLDMYKKMYNEWVFEMHMGYSLVFYGIGSKYNLLMDFVSELENDVLVVNGYNPDTDMRVILHEVANLFVPEREKPKLPKPPGELVNALAEKLALSNKHIYLLIHNVDGESMRGEKDQVVLSRLAGIANIHLLASVDQFSAPLMWNSAMTSSFRFVWHHVPTFDRYTIETSFDKQLTQGKESQQTQTQDGAQYVLESLTENSRKLFRALLCHQMEAMAEMEDESEMATAAHGMEFKLLYQTCVEEFIVSNEPNFRNMVKEFIDHQMMVSNRDKGDEVLYIPMSKQTIESMVVEMS